MTRHPGGRPAAKGLQGGRGAPQQVPHVGRDPPVRRRARGPAGGPPCLLPGLREAIVELRKLRGSEPTLAPEGGQELTDGEPCHARAVEEGEQRHLAPPPEAAAAPPAVGGRAGSALAHAGARAAARSMTRR